MFKQIAYASGNPNQQEEPADSDVYQVWDTCVKFYHIPRSDVETYNTIQGYLSRFKGAFSLKEPLIIPEKYVIDAPASKNDYQIERIEFSCLPTPEHVYDASGLDRKPYVVAELPYIAGTTLKDVYMNTAVHFPNICDAIMLPGGIMDTIRAFYRNRFLSTGLWPKYWEDQLVWVNMKVVWFDPESKTLMIIITDIWRDISKLVRNNQWLIQMILRNS